MIKINIHVTILESDALLHTLQTEIEALQKERKINENKPIEACGLPLTQYKAAVSEELSKEQIIEKKDSLYAVSRKRKIIHFTI